MEKKKSRPEHQELMKITRYCNEFFWFYEDIY
jgi:hypothetical protein